MQVTPPTRATGKRVVTGAAGANTHATMLDTLLQMGISRHRAERALAATGSRGVHIASDWLLAHVNDPTLDADAGDIKTWRHFHLYLCPVPESDLGKELQTFWDGCQSQIGWNRAHNSPPHITLCPPPPPGGGAIRVADREVETVAEAVSRTVAEFAGDFAALGSTGLELEKYASTNFVGLFVGKNQDIFLRSLTDALTQELSALPGVVTRGSGGGGGGRESVSSLSHPESFHLTLAYQFLPHHFPALQELLHRLDVRGGGGGCDWEVRLYSSDPRLVATRTTEAYRVNCSHSPRQEDELDLMIGDIVYINGDDFRFGSTGSPTSGSSSRAEGWVIGTSWLTGLTGYLPKSHVEKTANSDAWTLHCAVPLSTSVSGSPSLRLSPAMSNMERLRETTTRPAVMSSSSATAGNLNSRSGSAATGMAGNSNVKREERQIYIVRHGERVDQAFGASWIPYSFDENCATYRRNDLNMPLSVPKRPGGPEAFARDTPLTRIGCIEAQLTGEAMREAGVKISHVFVSPSLRCVQTAHHILQGLQESGNLKLHVEPGLFEWLAWYQDAMPEWMSAKDLVANGYEVDTGYEPYISKDELRDTQAQFQQPESVEQFYTRNFFVTRCILQATEEAGGNLLLVAHAATLDTCSRQVTGHEPRTVQQMLHIVRKVGYCGVAVLQEGEEEGVNNSKAGNNASSGSQGFRTSSESLNSRRFQHHHSKKKVWKLTEPAFPPLTYGGRHVFDWKMLLTEDPKKDT